MGIEIPESYGGGGATLLPLRPGRRGAVARRSVDRRARRRAEHARHQRAAALGQRRRQAALPADDWRSSTIGAYALSEAGSGSDAFALATRAAERGDDWVLTGRKLWITNGNEADLFIVFANVNPDAGYRGITAFLVERGVAGVHGRQEGRQARHPRQQHVRAALRGLPRARAPTCSARSARATRSRSRR